MLYFPFLRVKKGEINALSTLKSASKYAIRPILQVAPPDLDERGQTVKPSAEYVTKIANTLQSVLTPSSNLACYLDPKPAGLPVYLLRNLLFSISTSGGKFFPVYSLTGSEEYAQLYNTLIGKDKPYLLRIPLNEIRGTIAQKINAAIDKYDLSATNAFILLDAGDISSPTTPLGMYEGALIGYITQIIKLKPAGIILSSSALPSTMLEAGKWSRVEFPRHELELFENVKMGAGESIHFGDYSTGSVILEPSPSRVGAPKARYTFAHHYEVIKGQKVGPTPHTMNEQFYKISDMLTRHPDFSGPEFSWGDEFIFNASKPGSQARGNATTWVAVNTSHHLEMVVSMLPSM